MKTETFSVCIDANVYISGIAFGGNPLKVLQRALNRDFFLITSPQILEEVQRNLLGKLELPKERVERFLDDIATVSSIFVPMGKIKLIQHHGDSLVLETAIMGGATLLVTGDRKHLLPLGTFQGITIEPPSKFLARFQ